MRLGQFSSTKDCGGICLREQFGGRRNSHGNAVARRRWLFFLKLVRHQALDMPLRTEAAVVDDSYCAERKRGQTPLAKRSMTSARSRVKSSLLKLDVESAEASVLAGAYKTITSSGDIVMLFEAWDSERLRPCSSFLHALGFEIQALICTTTLPNDNEHEAGVHSSSYLTSC